MRITQHSKKDGTKPSLIPKTNYRKQYAGLENSTNFHKDRFSKNMYGPFGMVRKGDHIQQNLLLAKGFVKLQVESLKEIESTLILWANSLVKDAGYSEVNRLFAQPIQRLSKLTYNEISLFGNGTEAPLKIYYQKDGNRELLEVPLLPLLIQPAFSKIPIVCNTRCTISSGMLHACCGEVMGNHVIAESKLNQIDDVIYSSFPIPQLTGRSSFLIFLRRFFRRNPDHFTNPTPFGVRSSDIAGKHQVEEQ